MYRLQRASVWGDGGLIAVCVLRNVQHGGWGLRDMSVLYKALQKAEKDNELRQSATTEPFDTQRPARGGKYVGGRAAATNRIVMSAITIVAVVAGGGFLLFKDQLIPASQPSLPTIAAAAPAPAEPALQPPVEAAPAPVETQVAAAPPSPEIATAAPAEPAPAEPARAAEASVDGETAEADPATPPAASEAPASAAPAAAAVSQALATATAAKSRTQQRLPVLPADSPARMLSPPVTVNRAEFALAGIGSQVQVREVSKSARGNVTAAYDALVAGSYEAALALYDEALAEEPNSVMALLGRGAALQKLGRGQEAQTAYDRVLEFDAKNKEALTNITILVAARAPQDALTRLLELERENPTFSPVKAELGLTYAKMGSMTQALDYLRRAVALSPDAVMYHYNLALVLDHMGRREQAIASYEQVLTSMSGGISPAGLSAIDIERRMRFLRAR